MRRVTAVITGLLLACFGFAEAGSAQAQQPLQVQGTLEAANCQAQELTLNTSGGAATFPVTNQTAIYVNGRLTSVCALAPLAGAPVTAYLVPENSQFILGRLDVSAPQGASPPAPAGVAAPPSSSTAVGIALGALVLGGLAYLILHNATSHPAPAYDYGHRYDPRYCDGDRNWNARCR